VFRLSVFGLCASWGWLVGSPLPISIESWNCPSNTDPNRIVVVSSSTNTPQQAGGSAIDALRSIIISEQLLGTTEIVLVKHTDCGMLTFKHSDAVGVVEKNLGSEAVDELKGKVPDFLPFPELEEAVKDDINYLRSSKLVPGSVTISGWIYEVESVKTRWVV
jgi:carbonic anhydrase